MINGVALSEQRELTNDENAYFNSVVFLFCKRGGE